MFFTPQQNLTERLLCSRLRGLCSGRENHSDHFELEASKISRTQVRLSWRDGFERDSGLLAILHEKEARRIVRTLFRQLRQWRRRCAQETPEAGAAQVRAAGGGAR